MKTSKEEIKHLLIAWLAISFAFTILLRGWHNLSLFSIFIISALTVGIAFIFHELAHKAVAQRYGSWSEFRMEPMMLLIAILTAFMGIIFAAPGAVVIHNPYLRMEENGKIAVAGPMMNVALAILFFSFSLYTSASAFSILKEIGDFGVMINAWLALFNMIPFSVLDGRKVLAWNKKVYMAALALTIIVFVLSLKL